MRTPALALASLFVSSLVACGGSATVTGYQLVLPSGETPSVHAGDNVLVAVGATMSDGSIGSLPAGATVSWSVPTVAAISATSAAPGNIPAFGAGVTAFFISNTLRSDRPNDLGGQLFFADPGTAAAPTLALTATVSGVTPAGTASLTFNVAAPLTGSASNGAILFGASGANCAGCHGATAAGSPANPDGSFSYNNSTYSYPAPGLDAEPGNLGSDPAWNPALLAMAVRADMDNGGLELRAPMPDFLTEKVNGAPLSTQQIADIYAWLQTQQ